MRVAGKYGKLVDKAMSDRAAMMAAGGGGALGLAALGNVGSGEAAEESGGRQALEGIGAAALGIGAGAMLPGLRARSARMAGDAARNFGDAAQGVQSPMGARQRAAAEMRAGAYQGMQDAGMTPEQAMGAIKNEMRAGQIASNVLGTAALVGGAGAIGGQLGGGVANVGNMLGLSIDPEAPGSSNTQNSRLSMQTRQLPMY